MKPNAINHTNERSNRNIKMIMDMNTIIIINTNMKVNMNIKYMYKHVYEHAYKHEYNCEFKHEQRVK